LRIPKRTSVLEVSARTPVLVNIDEGARFLEEADRVDEALAMLVGVGG
jgi:hypothetical protein